MILLEDVTHTYPEGGGPALESVNLSVARGGLVLFAGPSGGGKTTSLRTAAGLIPRFFGGTFSGRVSADGVDIGAMDGPSLASIIGHVPQNPRDQGVMEVVDDEIAFTLENLGSPRSTLVKRVEETLDAIGIAHLRDRKLDSLSGGERQKVAIAASLAAFPRYLLLDEPTSQLDPQSSEEVLSCMLRLRDEMGLGLAIAEHRLERVLQYASAVAWFQDGRAAYGPPREALFGKDAGPPVMRLARALNWVPLPLSLNEARPFAETVTLAPVPNAARETGDTVARSRNLGIDLGERRVLKQLDIEVRQGEVIALMGRNGSGKTTLLRAFAGLISPRTGSIDAETSAYVPQDPDRFLFAPHLSDEVRATLRARKCDHSSQSVHACLAGWGLESMARRNPRDLSGGERTLAAIAVATAGAPRLILLDEPTRGMDVSAKERLKNWIASSSQQGSALIVATHDVELAAEIATRVVILAEGEIIIDSHPLDALSSSMTFSTQMDRLFDGQGVLTVEDVQRAVI